MKKKWKILFGVLILVAAASFITVQATGSITVNVKEISPEEIKHSFTEEGTVEPAEDRNVITMHTAKIDKVHVEDGDHVKQGELLVELNPRELNYTIEELRAQVRALEGERQQLEQEPGEAEIENIEIGIEHAKDTLKNAETRYEKIKEMYRNDFATESELKEAEDMVKQAELNLNQQKKSLEILDESFSPPEGSYEVIDAQKSALESQIEFLKEQKEEYQMHAPIQGIVTDLQVEEMGLANPERPLMKIRGNDKLQIETRVLTRDVYEIEESMEVSLVFERREKDVEFTGEISEIAPYAEASLSELGLEEERVPVTITPEIPEDIDLGPGYKVDVEFITEKQTDQLVVPKSALFTHEGQDAVFTVENDRAKIQKVNTGLETNQKVAIKDGLEDGDKVILNPDKEDLQEGTRINIQT